ncbi:amino acid/metabolite permease [Cryptococcus bacillisporus CA1873]|uniref:Amino acid/metabolite permease n=1 Tax=Cryptococcus bacillisporus CA1873 TaxID=1296111 RepID=A0ABR5BJ34_CRYGA|nr:amino acid/metabolite permease [Cryptococcus bacillisporus CA1873]|eukprot:KIR69184.1 amino acid/metabolite permease [Cryptococcus gattii CA1873]
MSKRPPLPSVVTSQDDTAYVKSSTSFKIPATPYNSCGDLDASDNPSIPLSHSSTRNLSDAVYDSPLGSDLHIPLSGDTPSSSIRRISVSSHSSSYLLPNPTLSMTKPHDIPYSSRPIPAPPVTIHHDQISNQPSRKISGDAASPVTELSRLSSPPGVKFGMDLRQNESRGSASQEDVDAQRLRALGYDAVLGRDYTFWSSLAISWLNIGALQGTIFAVSGTYNYGGPVMILVAWPVSGVLTYFMTLTLSELASAYPVAGAMFSWSWKTARGGIGGERGWAWILLLVTWEIANIVVGTIGLSLNYQEKNWHNFLLFLGILVIVGLIGSTGWGQSHCFWLCSGAFGFSMWLVLCITLLATNATKHDPGDMFNQFYNTTGWSSKPYVYILGWQYTTIASGADASAHMAEETQNPSRNVPNAMTTSVIATYVLGYISIVLLLLSISPEDAVTVKSHSFAFGYILTKAISKPGAITICCLMVVVLTLQVLAQLQASSRFVFALARENGMPFSSIIRKTNNHRRPVFAVWLVVILCLPFACLTLASESTLYSVLAVTACTLSYVGYAIPISLYLVSRINLQTEGRSLWSLRKWSKPVAIIGLLYALALIVTQTFPGSTPVKASTMSWSPVIIAGTGVMCYVTWKCYGDKHFAGPIRAITKWESGMEIDLSTTLASSRSRHSGFPQDQATNDSLKLALSPYYPSGIEGPGADVTVQSAAGSGITSEGEWTSASESDNTISAWTQSGDENRKDEATERSIIGR